ncbi:hypothetical protein O181_126618 [Austropuccinia psidii MF-1]|uniref:Chromo domain-containing protein n=1 Tax=Austropuccinia psidii MF-1 TaxID=1389203 RepID=A0A9Q3KRP3_9BASI|nr:hypothetical protein [Austropuccinia psidii MF-1]
MMNPYKSGNSERFPLRNEAPQKMNSVQASGSKEITKLLKERKLRTKTVREYMVRYSDPTCEDKWLAEKDIPEATKLLRGFRHTRKENITE